MNEITKGVNTYYYCPKCKNELNKICKRLDKGADFYLHCAVCNKKYHYDGKKIKE